jgi:putative flippase GtrA
MGRFREELNVIAFPAWVLAGLVFLAIGAGMMFLNWRHGGERASVALLLSLGISLMVFSFVLLAGYVYGDARRRGMRQVMWTLLAIFIPNGIGFILYFLLRDPLQHACVRCGASVSSSFPFCPACGAAQSRTCPECNRPVQPGWSHCAQCGARLRDQ